MTSLFSDLILVSPGLWDFFIFEAIFVRNGNTQWGPEADCEKALLGRSLRRFKRLKSPERRVWLLDKHKQKHRRLSQSQVREATLHLCVFLKKTVFVFFSCELILTQ